jgi:hypothetical protein
LADFPAGEREGDRREDYGFFRCPTIAGGGAWRAHPTGGGPMIRRTIARAAVAAGVLAVVVAAPADAAL